MATTKIKVRALVDGALDRDCVVVDVESVGTRFFFEVSPKGTAFANIKETEIDNNYVDAVKAAIVAKVGLTIQNNPAWADVNTDDGTNGDNTAGDGINEGTRYNWATNGKLYEIPTS